MKKDNQHLDYDEIRKFAHDVKNHLTAANLQVQVMGLLAKDAYGNRLEVIQGELEKAGDLITELQVRVKAIQQSMENEEGGTEAASEE